MEADKRESLTLMEDVKLLLKWKYRYKVDIAKKMSATLKRNQVSFYPEFSRCINGSKKMSYRFIQDFYLVFRSELNELKGTQTVGDEALDYLKDKNSDLLTSLKSIVDSNHILAVNNQKIVEHQLSFVNKTSTTKRSYGQRLDEQHIKKFMEDRQLLPYDDKDIADKMDLARGSYSRYVSGKLPMTHNFLRQFYAAWDEELWKLKKKHVPVEVSSDELPEEVVPEKIITQLENLIKIVSSKYKSLMEEYQNIVKGQVQIKKNMDQVYRDRVDEISILQRHLDKERNLALYNSTDSSDRDESESKIERRLIVKLLIKQNRALIAVKEELEIFQQTFEEISSRQVTGLVDTIKYLQFFSDLASRKKWVHIPDAKK